MTKLDGGAAEASSEKRLLLLCARARLSAAATSAIAERIDDGLDWTSLIGLALHHRVAPALLAPLTQPAVSALVPDDIAAALEHYGDATRARNRYLATEFAGLLSAFADEDITALPFKGVVLAEMLYGDLGQRPPGDLDFLVRPNDVSRVYALLVSRGFSHSGGSALRTPIQHDFYRRYQCEYQFVRGDGEVVTELHWAIAQRVRALDLDYGAHFDRSQPAVIAGRRILVHGPEDLVLLLCVHGAKHEWAKLGWIRDVAAVLERTAELGLDLERALVLASQQGCARVLLLGLEVAHRLLDAPLPAGIRRAISTDAAVASLADHVVTRLFLKERPPTDNARVSRFGFLMLDSAASRLRYMSRTLLMPRVEHLSMVALPAPLAWGYYPLRWGHDYLALPLWNLTRPLRAGRPRSAAASAGRTSG